MYQVLIVDDEPIVKIALRSVINWNLYGYSICATASDGKEALALVDQHTPDLVITDLKMPVMDGISLIRALKEQQFKGEILVISNYDDFESVRSALVLGAADYILKVSIEEENLTKQLKAITERLDTRFSITDVSREQEQKKYEKMQFHQQLKEFLEDPQYTVGMLLENSPSCAAEGDAVFTAFYLDFPAKKSSPDKKFSNTLVYNSLKEVLDEVPGKEILFLSQSTVLIFFPTFCTENCNSFLHALGQKLLSIFELYLSVSPTVIFQEDIHGYQSLKQWYTEFLHIMTLNFYEPLKLLHADGFQPIHYMSFLYYKDFVNLIQNNRMAQFADSVEKIADIIGTCRTLHVYPEILKTFFTKSLDLLEYLNYSPSIEIHDYLLDLKEGIQTCENAPELSRLVTLAAEAVFSPPLSIVRTDLTHLKAETQKAMEYINTHYGKRIALSAIAETVNLSASYLCRLFKSEVGMSITGYLNQVRMEKAGFLLRTSNINVYMKEISAAVGIEDQLYFSRIFKKYYGISPSEYRTKHDPASR